MRQRDAFLLTEFTRFYSMPLEVRVLQQMQNPGVNHNQIWMLIVEKPLLILTKIKKTGKFLKENKYLYGRM